MYTLRSYVQYVKNAQSSKWSIAKNFKSKNNLEPLAAYLPEPGRAETENWSICHSVARCSKVARKGFAFSFFIQTLAVKGKYGQIRFIWDPRASYSQGLFTSNHCIQDSPSVQLQVIPFFTPEFLDVLLDFPAKVRRHWPQNGWSRAHAMVWEVECVFLKAQKFRRSLRRAIYCNLYKYIQV